MPINPKTLPAADASVDPALRRTYAAAALTGLLASDREWEDPSHAARLALKYAEALMSEIADAEARDAEWEAHADDIIVLTDKGRAMADANAARDAAKR